MAGVFEPAPVLVGGVAASSVAAIPPILFVQRARNMKADAHRASLAALGLVRLMWGHYPHP